LDLIKEQSYSGLTLRRIAARAGMSAPGLLRHFTSKDEILAELITRLVDQNQAWMRDHTIDTANADDLVVLAAHNASVPGFAALFSTLAGAATSSTHPAHDFFRRQYADNRAAITVTLQRLARESGQSLDYEAEAVRLIAGWDGLQLQTLYDDTVVVADEVSRHLGRIRGEAAGGTEPEIPTFDQQAYLTEAISVDYGYAVGRERRAEIVEQAMHLFARDGYHGVSLREIGEALSIPKSSLLHHFPTKEALLQAVLAHRDTTIVAEPPPARSAREELLTLIDSAQDPDDQRGLIAVYAVLSGEGAAREHPAHDYFVRRLQRVRRYLADLLHRLDIEGSGRPGLNPQHEALWLVALWDGLQLQWLYDPQAVDLGTHLQVHARALLSRPLRPPRTPRTRV
jgi:AcrR family transcriptional regulator